MAMRPLPSATAASSAETSHNGTAGTPPRLAPSPTSMAAATRRAVLCGIAVAPVAAASAAVVTPAPDPTEWNRLCAAFRDARAEELRLLFLTDDMGGEWHDKDHEPKPSEPDSPPLDTSLPFATYLAQSRTPEWKARWAAYEADLAGWNERQAARKAAFMGDTPRLLDAALAAADAALSAVKAYPVSTLAMLAEKGELVNEACDGYFERGEVALLVADMNRLASQGVR